MRLLRRVLTVLGLIGLAVAVVFTVRSVREQGWGDIDPAGLAGATVGAVLGGVSLYAGRRLTTADELADSLATRVRQEAERAYAHMFSGDLNALIDLSYTARLVGRVHADRSEGRLSGITAFYRALDPARLVITGAPAATRGTGSDDAGTGKSVALARLVTELAQTRERERGGRVPMLLSASSWPGGTIVGWLESQLAGRWKMSRSEIRKIMDAQLLLPVIDGLDEMDRSSTPAAETRAAALLGQLDIWNEGTRPAPFVVTCRYSSYKRLERAGAAVRSAAVLRLDRVTPGQARHFLADRVAHHPAALAAWRPVLDALDPDANRAGSRTRALREALDTPWRLMLAAIAYAPHTEQDPVDLLTRAGDGTLQRHLLRRFIPSALARPTLAHRRLGRLDPDLTHRQLHVLAAYLQDNTAGRTVLGRVLSSTDIELHELWPMLGQQRIWRTERWIMTGPAASVAISWFLLVGPSNLVLGYCLGSFVGVAVYFLPRSAWPEPRFFQMPLTDSGSFSTFFRRPPTVLSPRSAIRWDLLTVLLMSLTVGLSAGATYVFKVTTNSGDPSLVTVLVLTQIFAAHGLLLSLIIPARIMGGRAALRYLAFRLVAGSAGIPISFRLGRFLHLCQERGILRTAGASWQFRHGEIQRYLAAHPNP